MKLLWTAFLADWTTGRDIARRAAPPISSRRRLCAPFSPRLRAHLPRRRAFTYVLSSASSDAAGAVNWGMRKPDPGPSREWRWVPRGPEGRRDQDIGKG